MSDIKAMIVDALRKSANKLEALGDPRVGEENLLALKQAQAMIDATIDKMYQDVAALTRDIKVKPIKLPKK